MEAILGLPTLALASLEAPAVKRSYKLQRAPQPSKNVKRLNKPQSFGGNLNDPASSYSELFISMCNILEFTC